MPLPGWCSESVAQLQQNEAVMLFAERAAAAGTFELSDANRVAVVRLCRRLDGLPLAIELAAVRTRVLTVEQILGRLDDRFALLTSGDRVALPRHQTLRAAIDWSYDLLTTAEQTVLRRLGACLGRAGARQHSCGASRMRRAPRLCPRIGYRGLAALLLGDPRDDGEHSLAGPTAGLRRCLSAAAGKRLLPARVAERA